MYKSWTQRHAARAAFAVVALAASAFAQTPAMPRVHDPSTIVRDGDTYYVFTTGRGIPILSSPDGVNWARTGSVFTQIPESVHAAVPKNNGTDVWAPDVIRVNGQYYLYYAVSSWNSFVSAIALATSPTLNPKDPTYHWTDRGVVVRSDGVEDLNAIDPGVISAPDGTLWVCYGSYHGTIQMIQLDPKTGLRVAPNSPVSIIATSSEASDIVFRGGYYYLFVNHGSCCQGRKSGYTIRVGRSKLVTGPYLDRHGDPLTKVPGTLFLAAHDHRIGPGHFGRMIEDGAERFSLHYEADLSADGRSTLGLRPLLWAEDGWPIAGDTISEATYQIISRQTEDTLELRESPKSVDEGAPRPNTESSAKVPAAFVPNQIRMTRYLTLDNQKWIIAPAAGGYSKILNLASGEALQVEEATDATGQRPVGALPFADTEMQLWHLDQLPNSSYRIRNKGTGLCLTLNKLAGAPNPVVASPFTADDSHQWMITTP